ncbi:pre-rRNA-processing protein TSR1 homolog [Antedon mediterranea]|uniref:pre-rRNA-processing protein TSR1 homolog n=1 Tax=Antedon mediterranea TaxID=105859 RepID=UPI003AF9A8C4
MAVDGQETHRSGTLKQKNKTHKTGRHRSKGQLETISKGRVSVKTISKKLRKDLSKNQRRHQANQIRQKKKDDVINRKRKIGGKYGAPHLVTVFCAHQETDVNNVVNLLKSCDESAIISQSESGLTCDISIPRFKQRFTLLLPPPDLKSILDAAKASDSIVAVLSPDEGWDAWGELCLTSLFAQGLPATTLLLQGMVDLSIKKKSESKKNLQKIIEKRFPKEKIYTLDSAQDAILLLRHLGDQKLSSIRWRDTRPHILARSVNFEPNPEQCLLGTLKVSGFLRGRPLSVNGLIHIPGYGEFQMKEIDSPPDPCPLKSHPRKKKSKADEMNIDEDKDQAMDEDINVLEVVDTAKQESLQAEAEMDPMEGEQTWPTEEEMADAEAALKDKTKKILRKVPKGTSEYQAAWILDNEEEEEESSEDESENDDASMQDEDNLQAREISDEEGDMASIADTNDFETISITGGQKDNYDKVHFDEEEDLEMLNKYREERMNAMFPDEVDTPRDVTARTRFARYRGLKSFRSSPWDPKENLPLDYARIFQFQNFNRTKKKVEKQEIETDVQPGMYITIHIVNVPKSFIDDYNAEKPLVLFGLLQHEQKMSVLHFALKRQQSYAEPIKSKDRLIFQTGYRSFTACPIFSQHTVGDKQKYERFFPIEGVTVASVYAPVVFPPANILVFKELPGGSHVLVATGTLLSANPDRVVVKKVVLSGHPFKIMKRQAVVRYMFFNREDILWFKPIELKTKWGRRGHIKEPLGTHGHMKCIFDGQMKSQDTVLMTLYKRIYPKWTYDVEGSKGLEITPATIGSCTYVEDYME